MDEQPFMPTPVVPTPAPATPPPAAPMMPVPKKSHKGYWVTAAAVIVLLAAVAYAWMWLYPTNPVALQTPTTSVSGTPLPAGVATFSSETLGIRFDYLASQGNPVIEEGNTVYVRGKSGQWVREFAKKADESFEQSIKRQILQQYPSTSCKIEVTPSNILPGYQVAEISYPPSSDTSEPWFANQALCNPDYDKTNGIRYFLYNPAYPDKFFFFSIGQYSIAGAPVVPGGGGKNWQDTFAVFK